MFAPSSFDVLRSLYVFCCTLRVQGGEQTKTELSNDEKDMPNNSRIDFEIDKMSPKNQVSRGDAVSMSYSNPS